MWPFKKKNKEDIESEHESTAEATVASGINWKEILSEGKTIELFDGCRAKCDGTFEDL